MKHIVQISIGAVAIAIVGTNYLVHRKSAPPVAPAVAAAPSGPVLIKPPVAPKAAPPAAVAPRPQAMAPVPAVAPPPAPLGGMEPYGGVQRPADPPPVIYRPPSRTPHGPQQ